VTSEIDPLKAFVVKPNPNSFETRFNAQNVNPDDKENGESWSKKTPTKMQKKPVIEAEV
jgi:hypothetical protein